MTQAELNQQIANATGDSLAEISRLGFQVGMVEQEDFDADDLALADSREIEDSFVDWDDLELHRNLAFFDQREPLRVA